MTWKELKDFCNSLPESELEKKVVFLQEFDLQEFDLITDFTAEFLEEDYYSDPENEFYGSFPESEAINMIMIETNEDAYPGGMSYFKKAYSKGHPVLFEKF